MADVLTTTDTLVLYAGAGAPIIRITCYQAVLGFPTFNFTSCTVYLFIKRAGYSEHVFPDQEAVCDGTYGRLVTPLTSGVLEYKLPRPIWVPDDYTGQVKVVKGGIALYGAPFPIVVAPSLGTN